MTGFIAIHLGAGKHSEKKQKLYETLSQEACKAGIDAIKGGKSALDAVAICTALLEDSPLTNAGIGSNLTWDGHVECDASIIEGSKLGFAAVGAVAGVKNPILLARDIYLCQDKQLPLNRVPPCFLVGQGAALWAEERGLETVPPEKLITVKSLKAYNKFKRRATTTDPAQCLPKERDEERLDTVGAIAVDLEGIVAASCSSGGIMLKHSGRVGQGGVYGCGCWAQNQSGGRGVAVSVSGCGEDLIKTCLARQVAHALSLSIFPSTALHASLQTGFLESPYLGSSSSKLCGVVGVVAEEKGKGEFVWGHTTETMFLGWMSTANTNTRVRMSKLPEGVKPGTAVSIEGVSW